MRYNQTLSPMSKINEKSIHSIMTVLKKTPQLHNYSYNTFHGLVVNMQSLLQKVYYFIGQHGLV